MKLLLFVLFFIGTPMSCVDGVTSSLGPVAPIVKPIGKVVKVLFSSVTPLVNSVKKIPIWSKTEKPEIKLKEVEKIMVDRSAASKEETAIDEKAVVEELIHPVRTRDAEVRHEVPHENVVGQEDVVVAVVPPQQEEVVEEDQDANPIEELPPPPQESNVVIVQPVVPVPVVVDPVEVEKEEEVEAVVLPNPQNVVAKKAMEALEKAVNEADFKNSRGQYRKKVTEEINKIKRLEFDNKKQFIPKVMAIVNGLRPNQNNEQRKADLLSAVKDAKDDLN